MDRVLVTVKHSAVNAVFPLWPIVEFPNLCFPNEYQNVEILKSKFKSEKSNKKKKKKSNVDLKENKKKKTLK